MISKKIPPLALYIHMPWCIRKCPYCDFNSHKAPCNRKHFSDYITALCLDLERQIPLANNRKLVSIYIGGGTPTLFQPQEINKLIQYCKHNFKFAENIEISMESNPATILSTSLHEYKEAGINRLSMGIQSLNDSSLKRLNRIHDRNVAIKAILTAKEIFSNFNLDLMHSLPGQSTAMAIQDLKEVIAYEPPHLSWYQLTLEANTPFGLSPPTEMPNETSIEETVIEGFRLLESSGYKHYEVSAFAKNNKECIHNRNYWMFGDYLAAGAGAHSKITTKDVIQRTARVESPLQYISSVPHNTHISESKLINNDDVVFEYFLNRLRLFEALPLSEFTDYTGLPLSVITDKLDKFTRENLITISNGILNITHKGHLFVNHMLEDFL
jgi:putative oxygen-independent coproporphyrinogen III oxidase